MENKENHFIHHEVLHIPQMKWSVPGLQSFTCSLARGSNKSIQRDIQSFLLFGKHIKTFMVSFQEPRAWFLMKIAGHPKQATAGVPRFLSLTVDITLS